MGRGPTGGGGQVSQDEFDIDDIVYLSQPNSISMRVGIDRVVG